MKTCLEAKQLKVSDKRQKINTKNNLVEISVQHYCYNEEGFFSFLCLMRNKNEMLICLNILMCIDYYLGRHKNNYLNFNIKRLMLVTRK